MREGQVWLQLRSWNLVSARQTERIGHDAPDRDLSDNEFDLLVGRMDKVFKVARPPRADPLAASPNRSSPCPDAPTENVSRSTPDSANLKEPAKTER